MAAASSTTTTTIYVCTGPGGLLRFPKKGDKVQTYSSQNHKYLEGAVEDVLTEPLNASGLVVPKGAVRVRVPAGVRFIKPENVCSLKLALRVQVVAPGAGTGLNGDIYKELGEDTQFKVDICGKRGAPYDRYPPCWEHGHPAPNLETWTQELLTQPMGDVLVCGSRGGQVVLPRFWQKVGDQIPPAVVINGGCAMNLPGPKIAWPNQAVNILLLGGQDFFKGQKSSSEYLASTKKCIPVNTRTAIIYVRQMQHVPQKALLQMVLRPLVLAAAAWQFSKINPEEQLRAVTNQLEMMNWSGALLVLTAGAWKESTFGVLDGSPRKKVKTEAGAKIDNAVEVTRTAELRALLRAAVADVAPKNSMTPKTSLKKEEVVDSATAAASGYREAAKQARDLAKVEAQKVKDVEAEIQCKEEELKELRQKLTQARAEELRWNDVAEAQEAEAVAAEADAQEAFKQEDGSAVEGRRSEEVASKTSKASKVSSNARSPSSKEPTSPVSPGAIRLSRASTFQDCESPVAQPMGARALLNEPGIGCVGH